MDVATYYRGSRVFPAVEILEFVSRLAVQFGRETAGRGAPTLELARDAISAARALADTRGHSRTRANPKIPTTLRKYGAVVVTSKSDGQRTLRVVFLSGCVIEIFDEALREL